LNFFLKKNWREREGLGRVALSQVKQEGCNREDGGKKKKKGRKKEKSKKRNQISVRLKCYTSETKVDN